MLFENTSSRSISNLVLYPRSGFGGKIFVLGSIRFNRESVDSRFLQYTERHRERVVCGESGTVITVGSMSSHLMTRHGKAATRRHLWAPQTNGGPMMYKMYFPAKGGHRRCLVERCLGVLATQAEMRVHFLHRHVHNTVVILEEGNLPLPRCPRCDLQVSRKELNGHHLGTSQCRTGTERKRRRLAEATHLREGVPRLWEADEGIDRVPIPWAGLNRNG